MRAGIVVSGIVLAGLAGAAELDRNVMSAKYREIWSDEVRAGLDRDIEKNRKADGVFKISAPAGTEVAVEQIKHAFGFGANAEDIGRQSSAEVNLRYEERFAALFNQMTIFFCWRVFEPAPGNPHFHTQYGDLEHCFNSGERARMDAHSRFLASPTWSTDQSLEFAKSHGMKIHGHTLVWSNVGWNHPYWLYEQFCPEEEKDFLRLPRKPPREIVREFGEWEWTKAWKTRMAELFEEYTEEEIAARCPVYLAALKKHLTRHITEVMDYCGDRVDSWDVVNESAGEHPTGALVDKPLVKCVRHGNLMPKDYVYESYRIAAEHATSHARLTINDNWGDERYDTQIADLLRRGARIDMVGLQFHIFLDKNFNELVEGKPFRQVSQPEDIRKTFARLGSFGRPVHLSEITIPSPGDTPEGLAQQAIVATDLYQAWFAQPSCCAITWWHTIDGADQVGGVESGTAGLLFQDGSPKPVYEALYDLIHRRWHTSLRTSVNESGEISFRGFRGAYRLTWRDANGRERTEIVRLK